MSLYYAVVLYNKNLEESTTCCRLKNDIKAKNVIIADNSTKKNNAKEWCEKLGWDYISMNENAGLSKAYNAIIQNIKLKDIDYENDFVMTLDDDTKITASYIDILEKTIDNNKESNIIMPIIEDTNNTIISPARYTKIRISNLKNKNEALAINKKYITAINTCLAIRLKIFKNYKYDENLFLDNVDHQFFYDMRNLKENFLVIDYEIIQNFFSTSNSDYTREIIRKKLMYKDYKIFVSNKSIIEKILYYPRIVSWTVKGCLKFKTIKFLIEIFKEK